MDFKEELRRARALEVGEIELENILGEDNRTQRLSAEEVDDDRSEIFAMYITDSGLIMGETPAFDDVLSGQDLFTDAEREQIFQITVRALDRAEKILRDKEGI